MRAVVLNYNGDPHVYRSVQCLLETDWPADRLQVTVVDNASTDGSAEELARRFPDVDLRRLDTNTGFPANNAALRDLDGPGPRVDYVALVNNDAFVTPGWLRPLVELLDGPGADKRIAAACPKLVFAPRFVELVVTCPTFRVPRDPRDLGVRVSGVEVDGVDVWRSAQFPTPGFWGLEAGPAPETVFCWTAAEARLRVPQPADRAEATATVRVRLTAVSPTAVTLTCGPHVVEVEVGPTPTWFEVALAGEPFDVVQNAGSVLVEGGYGADRGFLHRDDGSFDEPVDVFAWCGGGVLFRPAYLAEVGLFDERFFAYYEDTDLAWRGRARGWRYRYEPASVIRHQHATTSVEGSPLFNRLVERNRLLMLTKNAPAPFAARAVGRFLLTTASYAKRDLVAPVLSRHRPRPRVVVQRLQSFWSYVTLLPGILADRRRIRRAALVTDEELLRWSVRRPG